MKIGTASLAAETRFHAMGCAVHIVVVGGPRGLCGDARTAIDEFESLWSRFRPGSDISRCNASGGHAVDVAPATVTLVARAIEGWQRTGGRFDPTVLTTLEALGYDRSFEQIRSSVHPSAPTTAPGCGAIVVDPLASTVTIPQGVRFDPGGVGKGLAADLVAERLIRAGAAGTCVNIGGDLRVVGDAPTADGWVVGLEDPYDMERDLVRAVIVDAGVATTCRTFRTWERGGTQVHHVIDPTTGASAWTDLASVTVVAATACWAEVLAKAAFIAGPSEAAALIAGAARSGLLVDDGGFAHALPGCEWEMVTPCLW
jgi:thiamine biosynthesis lipoprotein